MQLTPGRLRRTAVIMKTKLVLLMLVTSFILFLDATPAKADGGDRSDVLRYDDAGIVSAGDFSIYYWYPPDEETVGSLLRNGDFQDWVEGRPQDWTVWADSKEGWEEAHVAQIDFALTEEGQNDGFGLFVRNTGGGGDYYAGAYQKLDQITEAGPYWVTTHMTMWGKIAHALYNSVGWYGIGDNADPSSVEEWRELSPLPIPCPNLLGACLYIGRYETITIEPGQYFHLRVGHKFSSYNAWTVFGLDDFSIVPAGGEVIKDGFWPDGLTFWDPRQLR